MKKISPLLIALFALVFSGCFLFDTTNHIYYESFFLGTDSFELSGVIYDNNGRTQNRNPGAVVTVHIYANSSYIWEKEAGIDGRSFSLTIDPSENLLSSENCNSDDDLHWEFPYYFSVGVSTLAERKRRDDMSDIKTFALRFDLADNWWLSEFDDPYDTMHESIFYLYITEPADIRGTDHVSELTDTDIHYNCNFSQPGWYKVCEYWYHAVSTNRTGQNIKVRQISW